MTARSFVIRDRRTGEALGVLVVRGKVKTCVPSVVSNGLFVQIDSTICSIGRCDVEDAVLVAQAEAVEAIAAKVNAAAADGAAEAAALAAKAASEAAENAELVAAIEGEEAVDAIQSAENAARDRARGKGRRK